METIILHLSVLHFNTVAVLEEQVERNLLKREKRAKFNTKKCVRFTPNTLTHDVCVELTVLTPSLNNPLKSEF